MAEVQHTCTGCVPIDSSILETYIALQNAIASSQSAASTASGAATSANGAATSANNAALSANAAAAAANAAGITQAEASVDNSVGNPSVDVSLVNKKLTLAFHNVKGEKGDRGDGAVPIVDNLTAGGHDAALSAEMGKSLNNSKQATLVSGTNIKTVNGESLLGSGNITAGDPNAVKYTSQSLTTEQKTQARSNIGAGTYSKASMGIPASDLASAVQTSLGKADSAYQKPSTGIPASDFAAGVIPPEIDAVNVTVDNNTGTPSATGSVSGSTLSLAFQNLKGAKGDTGAKGATGATGPQGPAGPQGNTGSSVAYPYELVNNLTTDDATKGLSAAQGVALKSELSQLDQKADELDLQVNAGLESIPYNNPGTGYFIDLSVGIGNEVSLTPLYFASIPWKYAVKEVTTNVSVIVNGEGGASGRLWGFLDADNKLLSVADANVSATGLELSVPNGAVKVVINDKSGQVSYIKDANSRITRNGKAIEETNISLFGRNSANLNIENTGYVIRTGNYGSTAWTTPLAQDNFGYAKLNCAEGDLFFISAYGETYARAYAFCESDNRVIESSPADTGVSKLIVAPKNASYIVVNNDFVQNPTPVAIKVSDASLSQLFKEDSRINEHINNNIEVPVFGPNATEIAITITNYYLKTYGVGSTADTTPTSGTNYGYVKQNCVAGDVFLVYSKGGNTGLAYAFCSAEDVVLASSSPQEIVSGLVIAPEGTSYIVVNNYFVTIANPILYKLTDGALCSLKREISGAVTGETEKIKTTNIGGFYLKNNKIVLSGASISEPRNGYFEYAMQELGISCLNTSVASTNIYKLANLLYSSPDDFTDFDVLIMSHIHNYDVFTLPSGKNEFTATDYENDATIGPYIKTSSYYTGNLQAAGGYTADELYAMGFDYVLKKWASLCYALRNTTGYDSVFGKPFQVIIYTYWHDARTIYNGSVRQLAKKWGISLIKDDENIGFSKNQENPATGGQWSVLYGDTTGYVPTEVIDGVTYGVHPCRMTSEDYAAWQQSGVLDKDYLPFIQKVRANILIHTLKDAIMK